MLSEGTIRALPKAVLHDHLDGGLRPRRSSSWPTASATPGCPATDADALGAWFRDSADSGSLERYLETFDHTVGRDADRGRPAPGRQRVRAGPRRRRRGLRRDPLRPRAAPARGPDASSEVVEAVNAGFRRRRAGGRGGRAPDPGHGAAHRHAARGQEHARSPSSPCATATRASSGFDIAGAEAGFPPTRHLDAFEYLRRENAHFTIHAGEAFGLPSIWEAIQWCGADRLGHGVRIVDDISDGVPTPRRGRGLGRRWAASRRTCATGASPWRCARAATCRPARRSRSRLHPITLLKRAAVPRHAQHRQPADERHVDDREMQLLVDEAGWTLEDLRWVDDQRDEVGVPALRRAAGDHRRRRQARLRRRSRGTPCSPTG